MILLKSQQEEDGDPVSGDDKTNDAGLTPEPMPQPTPERQGNSSPNEPQQVIKKAKKPHSDKVDPQSGTQNI